MSLIGIVQYSWFDLLYTTQIHHHYVTVGINSWTMNWESLFESILRVKNVYFDSLLKLFLIKHRVICISTLDNMNKMKI